MKKKLAQMNKYTVTYKRSIDEIIVQLNNRIINLKYVRSNTCSLFINSSFAVPNNPLDNCFSQS